MTLSLATEGGEDSKVRPALIAALTHIHVGAGRSPGVVDLPIVRDPFGIPFIPGSSVKGALKTALAIAKNCIDSGSGRVKCNGDDCGKLCCLLGPEEGTEGASKLVITDFYPLLVPVPSLDDGFAYVTFPRLIKYAMSFIKDKNIQKNESGFIKEENIQEDESVTNIINEMSIINELIGLLPSDETQGNKTQETMSGETKAVTIGVERYEVLSSTELKGYEGVHPFLGTTKVYLLDDKFSKVIFDRITVKLTRIRVDRETKTVTAGALWTEEYLPHGTVLVGAFVSRAWKNKYCENGGNIDWKQVLGFTNGNRELVLGGKETVGKGLVRIIVA